MMNKLVIRVSGLIAFILLVTAVVQAQSEPNNRLVLIEESSADNCGPCYTASFTIRNLLSDLGCETVVMIRYGAWSSDDYNINNPLDNSQRVTYYGNTTVPKVWVDGQNEMVGTIQIADNLESFINNRSSVSSPLDIRCSLDTVNFTVSAVVRTNTAVASGNYCLRIAVVEKHYIWPSPPGTNGQTIFDYSLLDMVPNAAGTAVNLIAGDSITYFSEYDITAAEMHHLENIAVIAFVQNNLTKEILQAAYAGPVPPIGIGESRKRLSDKGFQLLQNYPNPFNPSTVITYQVHETGWQKPVQLTVYNTLGQKIRTLINARQTPGIYSVYWDGTDEYGSPVSSGVYLYRLSSGSYQETKKMTLTR